MVNSNFEINCYFTAENNFKLADIFREIAEKCAINLYFYKDKLYAYNLGINKAFIMLPTQDVINEITEFNNEILNDYEITWLYNMVETDQNNNKIGEQSRLQNGKFGVSKNGDASSSISYVNKSTAIFVGEESIKNHLSFRQTKKLTLPRKYNLILDINKFINYKGRNYEINSITYTSESNFSEIQMREIL
jgi:hypothetical protein